MLRDALKDFSWLGIANVVVKPLWFVYISVLCVRGLGAEQYGLMNAALSLGLIATFFSDFGVSQIAAREVSKRSDSASDYLSNMLPWRLLVSGAGLGVALIVALVLGYRAEAIATIAF